MTYIKTLTAPLIIIAGLALLTACGGGATPAEDANEAPVVNCVETPFDSPDTCEAEKITACQTHGTNVEAGGQASCANRINTACVANPFVYDGCDTLNDRVRNSFCALPANIFTHAECNKISNINDLRITYCSATDIFHPSCLDDTNGGKDARDSACQMHGTNAEAGGHANCDGRIRTACVANPFVYDGCDTLDDKIRTDFCAMPANIFAHAKCMNISNINDLRDTYCSDTEIFHASCLDDTYDGGDKRDAECQMHGTNVGAGGHASCDGRIRTACTTKPFMYPGCSTLVPDYPDWVRTFCRDTDADMGLNPFHQMCNELEEEGDRDTACLKHGTAGHATCPMQPGVLTACKLNPFAHDLCVIVPNIGDIRDTYCAGTEADGVANGSTTNECNVNHADWQGGFTGTLETTISTTQNQFLGGVTADSGLKNLDLSTATFDGKALGGDVGSGLGFNSPRGDASTLYHAGIFTTTNLGRPIETTTGTGQWNGSFWATTLAAATDFTLHINFANSQIAGIVRDGASANYYYLIGVYTAGYTGGLITGTVQYGAFTATKIDLTTATLPTPSTTPAPTSGFLRGIIGQDGAVGVFVSGDTLSADGSLAGGTGATGFAGGFVVNPTAKISPNVNYGDWARGFNVTPPASPATSAINQFLNAGTDKLVTAIGTTENTGDPSDLDFDDIYGINTIVSDSNNGVAWFDVASTNYYAGIFLTTDLGLPVTGVLTTTAMWSGQFQATGMASAVEFDLEVTFGTVDTFPNSVGGIAAFVASDSDHYLISGTYDANGVISGTVDFGAFTPSTRTPTDAVDTRKGVLTGLIGSNGAVGAFVSGTAIDDDGVITDGTGGTGYAGGFVASPFAGKVSYRDWVRLATPNATPVIPANPESNNLNQFVQSIGNDANSAAYTGQNFNVNLGSLNGDPADGFNVHHITATDDYLVGLSSTTSLGVALKAQPVGTWLGSFVAYEGGVATTTPFELTIDFADRNINTTITGTDYTFTATSFGSNDGVIRGTVNRGQITGNLQGLIGLGGAVGVFHSDTNAMVSFAGGFVAAPPPPPPPLPNHANFKWYYTQASTAPGRRLHTDLTTGDLFAFVEGTPTSLPTGDLTFTDTGRFAPVVVRLGEASNGDHGFALMYGDDSGNARLRAGLLSGTDLGAVLDNPPVTAWSGTIYTSLNVVPGSPPTSIPLTLTVNFNAGEINTTTPATHGDPNQSELVVNGRFGSIHRLPDGILGGTVDYALFGNPPINGMRLIGLIGADGVIGVFAGSNGATAIGGLQARPNP